jgi:hypothetical protein
MFPVFTSPLGSRYEKRESPSTLKALMISPKLLDFARFKTDVEVAFSEVSVIAELFGALDLTRSAHDSGWALGVGCTSGSGFCSLCSDGAGASTSTLGVGSSTAPCSGTAGAFGEASLGWGEALVPTGTTGTMARTGSFGVGAALGTAAIDEGVVGCVESASSTSETEEVSAFAFPVMVEGWDNNEAVSSSAFSCNSCESVFLEGNCIGEWEKLEDIWRFFRLRLGAFGGNGWSGIDNQGSCRLSKADMQFRYKIYLQLGRMAYDGLKQVEEKRIVAEFLTATGFRQGLEFHGRRDLRILLEEDIDFVLAIWAVAVTDVLEAYLNE